MNRTEIFARWRARRVEFARYGTLVDGAKLCDDFLNDLTALLVTENEEIVTLSEAAKRSGYTRAHLGRMVARGKIPNAGRANAPRIRACDIPQKPRHLPPERVPEQVTPTSKGQIVRSIVDAQKRSSR